jgi:Type VI secretion system (T6SS), amidase effector protein 4
MRPHFNLVSNGYPRKPPYDTDDLMRLIGWDDLVGNGNYANTCAIRVSIALIAGGMSIPGRMRIKAGPHKGKLIEPGQAALSHMLAKRSMLGEPEKFFGNNEAHNGIGARSGVVSFWRLHPSWANDTQGHIDIVSPLNGYLRCAGSCYFDAAHVWFWPLQS